VGHRDAVARCPNGVQKQALGEDPGKDLIAPDKTILVRSQSCPGYDEVPRGVFSANQSFCAQELCP